MEHFSDRSPHPELPYRSQRSIDLPNDDVVDLNDALLNQTESLRQLASPNNIEKRLYNIPLVDSSAPALDLSRSLWNRYDDLSVTLTNNREEELGTTFLFKSPQIYDHLTASLEGFGAWNVTPHDSKGPVTIISHAEILRLLGAKLTHNRGIEDLLHASGNLETSEIVYQLVDELETLAKSRTDVRTYLASEPYINDAFMSNVVASVTHSEGAEAVDYHVSISANGISVTAPTSVSPFYISKQYDHMFSVPYHTGVIETPTTTFSITADDATNASFVDKLVQNEPVATRAGDLLRQALQMVATEHLDFSNRT
jgi:hypothetical protein